MMTGAANSLYPTIDSEASFPSVLQGMIRARMSVLACKSLGNPLFRQWSWIVQIPSYHLFVRGAVDQWYHRIPTLASAKAPDDFLDVQLQHRTSWPKHGSRIFEYFKMAASWVLVQPAYPSPHLMISKGQVHVTSWEHQHKQTNQQTRRVISRFSTPSSSLFITMDHYQCCHPLVARI